MVPAFLTTLGAATALSLLLLLLASRSTTVEGALSDSEIHHLSITLQFDNSSLSADTQVLAVDYEKVNCHYNIPWLTLTCLYNQLWEDEMVLPASSITPTPANTSSTIGYWRLGMSEGLKGYTGHAGLGVYDASVGWSCEVVRPSYTTTPFKVGGWE